jgi:hypothetical protein
LVAEISSATPKPKGVEEMSQIVVCSLMSAPAKVFIVYNETEAALRYNHFSFKNLDMSKDGDTF